MNDVILPSLRPKIAELRAACAEADVMVAPPQQIAASFVADLTAIPWVSLVLSPVHIPSAYLEPQPTPVPIPRRCSRWPIAWRGRLAWLGCAASSTHQ